MEINIESRLPEVTRTVQVSTDAGVTAGRQIPDASRPDNQKPQVTRFDTVSIGTQPNNATVQEPIDVKKAVEMLNKYVQSQKKYVNFSVDKETDTTVIRIYKTETGELIKQFPTDEILAMIANIRKNIANIHKNIGMLHDSKV